MLPTTDRLLLGPGPSPVSDRVLASLGASPRSHLDPELLGILDDIRTRLARVFRAPEGSLALAVSGTGTSGVETLAANLVEPGRRALVVVSGYFGERLATILARCGAEVDRVQVEWGRAVDPADIARATRFGQQTLNRQQMAQVSLLRVIDGMHAEIDQIIGQMFIVAVHN